MNVKDKLIEALSDYYRENKEQLYEGGYDRLRFLLQLADVLRDAPDASEPDWKAAVEAKEIEFWK